MTQRLNSFISSPSRQSLLQKLRVKTAQSSNEGRCPIWEALTNGKIVAVNSSILGERVLWVRDEEIKERVQLKHPTVAVYTLIELQRLTDAATSSEQLRLIHEAKRALGGEVQLNKSEINSKETK